MSYQTLDLSRDARGVVRVRLNLPETRNALSAAMISELTNVAKEIGTDAEARAVVLCGAGKVFCAGADLSWMQAQIAADRQQRVAEATRLAMMLKALNEMPKPLIGRIHGGAFGGAVGLACVCDTVVAADDTKFGLTETRLGLIPATIGPYVLARIGEGMARRVFMSARIFSASEAQALGIASRVVPPDELDAAVEDEITPYLSVAPGAVGAAKALARSLGPRIDEAVIANTIERLADTWEGEEAAHGIAAFLNKLTARWVKE